jgi:hypothetical protein
MSSVHVTSAPSSPDRWTSAHQLAIETGLLFILAALLLWKGLLPGWKTLNTDFPNYYLVARLIREHYCLDRIYDWIWFQRIADHFGIGHQLVGFLGLTPFSALPIFPLVWLPVLEAKRLWIVCNVAFLAAALQLLSRQTGLNTRRVWLIALCAVIPLRTSFLFGQMHILVLLLLVMAYVCHMRGWQMSSGCCIALGAALKIYPVFFCIYFVVKRRWKALGAALLCTVLCLLLSYAITGPTATKLYFLQQLPRLLQGESQNPFASLTSSSALFHRLFLFEPELNPRPLVSSPLIYAAIYPLWQATLTALVLFRLRTSFQTDEREAFDWSMFLCLIMFLSSAPASYQFVILIAAAVPTFSVLLNKRSWKPLLAYLFLYFAACNIRVIILDHPVISIMTPLLYLTLWCGIALLLFYFALLSPPGADKNLQHENLFRVPAFKAAALALGLWLIGTLGAWSHLKDMRLDGTDRINPRDGAYLRSQPTNIDSGLLYVAMLPGGYRVLRGDMNPSGFYHRESSTVDQLTFTTNLIGKGLWVEEASGTGSRLAHLNSGAADLTACQIRDAENPAISSDGYHLAFLREDHGHGSAWITDLRDCARAGGNASPVRMTSPAYDVRTLRTGSSGTFLLSAIYQSRERIFTVSPKIPPRPVAGYDGTASSPAQSPNGTLLVMQALVAERWQLILLDLLSGDTKQLTHGDCNAYTPEWKDNHTLLYATDCSRGLGLTAITSLKIAS